MSDRLLICIIIINLIKMLINIIHYFLRYAALFFIRMLSWFNLSLGCILSRWAFISGAETHLCKHYSLLANCSLFLLKCMYWNLIWFDAYAIEEATMGITNTTCAISCLDNQTHRVSQRSLTCVTRFVSFKSRFKLNGVSKAIS